MLITAIYSSDTSANLNTSSTITTGIFLSNSTGSTSYTRPPSTSLSPEHATLLANLQISNFTQFFTSLYWAVNFDLGQSSPHNIFTNADLLSSATDVFHDNPFTNETFQDTPLGDDHIPADGYRAYREESVPLEQNRPAFVGNGKYLCWRRVKKPLFLGLIDVLVPSVVLLAFLCLVFYGVTFFLFWTDLLS